MIFRQIFSDVSSPREPVGLRLRAPFIRFNGCNRVKTRIIVSLMRLPVPALMTAVIYAGCMASALAEPHIVQDGRGHPTKISHLRDEQGDACHKEDFEGRILQRNIADDGLTITGLIVELRDGAHANYSIALPKNINPFWQHRISNVLLRVSAVGRIARGKVSRCRSPEIPVMLDEIE